MHHLACLSTGMFVGFKEEARLFICASFSKARRYWREEALYISQYMTNSIFFLRSSSHNINGYHRERPNAKSASITHSVSVSVSVTLPINKSGSGSSSSYMLSCKAALCGLRAATSASGGLLC